MTTWSECRYRWLQSLGTRIVTYADDLVILCRKGKAEEALHRLRDRGDARGVSVFPGDATATSRSRRSSCEPQSQAEKPFELRKATCGLKGRARRCRCVLSRRTCGSPPTTRCAPADCGGRH